MSLTPEQRVMRARLAAHVSSRTEDRSARTKPARAAMLRKFMEQVDPEGRLPEAERLRRAEHARRAFMTRIAYESSRARQRKAERRARRRVVRRPAE